jgi:hypothetical protein
MVRPVILGDPVAKIFNFIVSGSLRSVYYPKFLAMPLIQKLSNLFNWVSVHTFYSLRWVSHCYNPRCDISEI